MAREMKDSGVAWIDRIPIDWQTKNIQALFFFGKGLPITKDNLRDSGISVISYGQIHSKQNSGTHLEAALFRYVDEEYLKSHTSSLVHSGDFIFADTSEDLEGCGNCAYVDADMTLFAGYHTIILRSKDSADNRYFAYLFKSDGWRRQIRERVTGVKLFSVSQKILKDVSLIVPPKNMQRTIANYLDLKCAEIDAILDKTRTSISEYKKLKQAIITRAVTKGVRGDRPMKESGIEWADAIPEEIKVSRLGLHYDIILGKMLCSAQVDDSYTLEPYYCAADVHFEGISDSERKMMWFSPTEKELYLVRRNDLLVVEGGAGAGGCAIATNEETPTYIQNSIMIVRAKHSGDCRYVRYWLECLVRQGYIDVVCNKATIPHFTKDDQYFSEYQDAINHVIDTFEKFDADQAEVIATLYGAWNDLIIDKRDYTDHDIVDEVLNHWHPKKRRFPRDMWLRAIQRMRELDLVPHGYGRHTIIKQN